MESVVIVARVLAIPVLVFAARDVGERAFDAAVGAASSHRRNTRFATRGAPVAAEDSDDEHAAARPAIAWKTIGGRLHPDWSRLCAFDEPER